MTINIYTDGAYRSSSEIGSWAFAIYNDDKLISYHSQALEEVTNQQAEMLAVIHSLKHLEDKETPAEDVYLHSDSAYVVNCIEKEWWKKWVENNWKTSKGKDVKNKELWEELLYYAILHRVIFVKVKGHSDNEQNNFVDKLCNDAMDNYNKGVL